MKIFWSWQSDTPGNIGRHFVREALEKAIDQLKEDVTIDESEREELHLDHDRKGVPGSPDLAQTILAKIKEASVFIADVTPVGKSAEGKPLINSNIAIELGYALAFVGNEGLLMILNNHYGDREDLPFDLRHKAGPIVFNLSVDAKKEERKQAQQELVNTLKIAIRDCAQSLKSRPTDTIDETPSRSTVAQYFDDNEIIEQRGTTNAALSLRYSPSPLLYLRVIPTVKMLPLRGNEIKNLVYGIKLQPLNAAMGDGGYWGRNHYGGLTYSFTGEGNYILTSSQLFQNREIWGLDSTTIDEGNRYIPSAVFEDVLIAGLRHYLQFASDELDLTCPLSIEAGASKVRGFRIAMPRGVFWGPIHDPDIKSRQTLKSFEDVEVNRVLLAIFEDFYDAAGERRPENFRGFPAKNN